MQFTVTKADGSRIHIRPFSTTQFEVTRQGRDQREGSTTSRVPLLEILGYVPSVQEDPFEQWLSELIPPRAPVDLLDAIADWSVGEFGQVGQSLMRALKDCEYALLANAVLNEMTRIRRGRPVSVEDIVELLS